MDKLINWTAKRSGAGLVVTGIDTGTKHTRKIMGVDRIESVDGKPVAIDKGGTRHELG